jgi:3-dehydroquinate dehydratase type I
LENRPGICAPIVNKDLNIIEAAAPLVDLFEVRIDLIGDGWEELADKLKKPWLACNRARKEGGDWPGSEAARIDELLKAIDLGADIVDIELGTPYINKVLREVKGRTKSLLSYHDLKGTPPPEEMREIIRKQLTAGADICKLITTARSFADNIAVLNLISEFPQARVVAFAMGDSGIISRILCPLVGGDFTYASIGEGLASAPGQITARELRNIYGMLRDGR